MIDVSATTTLGKLACALGSGKGDDLGIQEFVHILLDRNGIVFPATCHQSHQSNGQENLFHISKTNHGLMSGQLRKESSQVL